MKPINLKRLATAILIPEAVGFIAALLSGSMGDAYNNYVQPPLSPPAILFPIAWAILYGLMGVASYVFYEATARKTAMRNEGLLFYGLQLGVNFLWPIIFFRLDAYLVAFAVLLILIVLTVITAVKFKKNSDTAFYLLVPYIVWLIFAAYLNLGVAILN